MRNSFHTRAAAIAALITAGAAGAALAETQEVMIFEEAFFPNVIYVEPGDEVKFLNLSGASRKVKALDESWESALVSTDASWSYTVAESSFLGFQAFASDDTTSEDYVGTLTFEAPPLSE